MTTLKLKAVFAAGLLAAGVAAQATPFYVDIGTNFGGVTAGKVNATSTSVKNEVVFQYDSNTVITDTDTNGMISGGDALVTNAGYSGVGGVGPLGQNQISGFNPNQTLGGDSNNGLGSFWGLTFSINNLAGVVTSVTGAGVPLFSYGPGLLELFVTFDNVTFNNFMDIAITGGGATGLGTILFGTADFTNVDAGYNDLFHAFGPSCAGNNASFYAISQCADAPIIAFQASQDSNVLVSQFTPTATGFEVTTNHNGSGTFAIPEPGSLALFGLALAGLGLSRKRKVL